jgi:hypothetical protein
MEKAMIFKPFYRDETGCAAYVFGCGGRGGGAVVDPRERDVAECPRTCARRSPHVRRRGAGSNASRMLEAILRFNQGRAS